jgi:type IV pilus assembly protein PilB
MSPDEYIQKLIELAVRKRVSDVHIEPTHETMAVRFRIDGNLQPIASLSFPMENSTYLLNKFKVLANLEPTPITTPLDGHFSFSLQIDNKIKNIEVRTSFFPGIYGEVLTLRIFNREEMLFDLSDLGLRDDDLNRIQNLISKKYGMVLVTGPTGTGKTTTLYSILKELNDSERNIITLEDPVEYNFKGMRQSNINPLRGFTFASGMKAILRQDPDVIMIGEVRDPETAEYTIQASLTGQLVLTTIHSRASTGIIARLLDMKIDRSLIAYALSGVISQRLVRKICEKCRVEYVPNKKYIDYFNLKDTDYIYTRGRGCDACSQTGYFGRAAIFEILEFNEPLQSLILNNAPLVEIRQQAIEDGMKTLQQGALALVLDGTTTFDEIVKVV